MSPRASGFTEEGFTSEAAIRLLSVEHFLSNLFYAESSPPKVRKDPFSAATDSSRTCSNPRRISPKFLHGFTAV